MAVTEGHRVEDFSVLDFRSLWAGRERTTEVEGLVLAHLLRRHDPTRRAELGTGDGRLSGIIGRGAIKYLGLDYERSFLEALRSRRPAGPRRRYIAANLYHLPFRDASLTSSVSVRVFNFLDRPEEALREIARVTRPGGRLLVTMHPHPSLGTLADDLKVRLRQDLGTPGPSRTLTRRSPMPVRPAAVASWSWRRSHWREIGRRAGWSIGAEAAVGLEDYRGLRKVPASVFAALGRLPPVLGLRPTWFVDWVRSGAGPPVSGPLRSPYLQCPRCAAPLEESGAGPSQCPGCRLVWDDTPELLDLRYPRPDAGGAR